MSLVFKKTFCFWVQVCLNVCEQKELSRNIASIFVAKVKAKETVLKLKPESFLNRSKSKRILHVHKLKFWIISYMAEYLYPYKYLVRIEKLFHILSYSDLKLNTPLKYSSTKEIPTNCNTIFWDYSSFLMLGNNVLLNKTCLLLSAHKLC